MGKIRLSSEWGGKNEKLKKGIRFQDGISVQAIPQPKGAEKKGWRKEAVGFVVGARIRSNSGSSLPKGERRTKKPSRTR